MLYGIIIYLISFFVISNQDFFKINADSENKYKNLNLSAEQSKMYGQKIQKFMNENNPHLNADFNLTQLSESTVIPTHLLSYVFNETFELKFTDSVNKKRIVEAKIQLHDKKNDHLKIASVAHSVGFNSLSAFNSDFRKFAGSTPSRFKEEAN